MPAPLSPPTTIENLKEILDESKGLSAWTLAMIAGSVAAIVSTSYLKPPQPARLIYFLFLPAWMLLGASMYHSNVIARTYIAAALTRQDLWTKLAQMNKAFSQQLRFFGFGLLTLAVWLILILFWWVLFERP